MSQRKTVIVVDDEPITRMDLGQLLEELGFSVLGSAADGFDAVELCRSHCPDIVLMDIKMPVFDGLTAAETIIREDLAGCVVLLTAFSDTGFIERATQIGVAGYLLKPIEERRILPALEVAIAQSRHLKRARQETANAKKQLEDQKIIARAKAILAREKGISEGDAYSQLTRMAMDKRCSLASLSGTIVNQNSTREVVNEAKELLIRTQGLSEQQAFRKISELAKTTGGDTEAVARKILSNQ